MDESLALGADAAPDTAAGRHEGAVRVGRGPERGVGEAVWAVVREGGVADTESVEAAQVGDAVADLVEAFNSEWRDELGLVEGGKGGGGVDLGRELGGVEGLEPGDEVDLLDGGLNDLEVLVLVFFSTRYQVHVRGGRYSSAFPKGHKLGA